LSTSNCASFFDGIEQAPEDAIFQTKTRYAADTSESKVNLGIGAYRTNDGKPWPLPSVKAAERLIIADPKLNMEYLPITGHAGFLDVACRLFMGDDFQGVDRMAKCQAISGTGALRLAAEFIAEFFPGKSVLISNPTWGNHKDVLNKARVDCQQYRYWDAKNRCLDLQGMLADIRAAPSGSVFMLHTCAHNPTGVDPSQDQWRQICAAIKSGGHFAWFDTAYQGFASGDVDFDGFAPRFFAAEGLEFIVSQSFAKNFGLYNQRAGAVYVLTPSATKAKAINSRLALYVRPMYSNPPAHGARIVHTILTDPQLKAQWLTEVKMMADRIIEMRQQLRAGVERLGTPGTWNHITDQIGMFTYTGLTQAQCAAMIDKHHVYLLSSGRISMAGVNSGNADYIARAIDDVVRNH
jgi:aspartate aminotransferase